MVAGSLTGGGLDASPSTRRNSQLKSGTAATALVRLTL